MNRNGIFKQSLFVTASLLYLQLQEIDRVTFPNPYNSQSLAVGFFLKLVFH